MSRGLRPLDVGRRVVAALWYGYALDASAQRMPGSRQLACPHLQCFWQVLGELIVTVAKAVADWLAPAQMTE